MPCDPAYLSRSAPSELKAAEITPGQRIRLFGLVEEGSVKRGEGLKVQFTLTDSEETISVSYNKILPDLFRENQGIITEGVLSTRRAFYGRQCTGQT